MDSDSPSPPKVFSHRVIKQMVEHMFGDTLGTLSLADYKVIRVVFTKCKGSWEKLCSGDMVQLELLAKIITGWGKMPNRKPPTEDLI